MPPRAAPPWRVRSRIPLVLAAGLGLIALCLTAAGGEERPPAPPWTAALGREHPLVGRIWQPATRTFVTPAALLARLGGARFVLLGEKHDHPDHHRLQAWIVASLVGAGRRPAVAFEMMSIDDDAAIARAVAADPRDPAAIARAVDWSRSGWPEFGLYAPIVRVALDAGVPIVGANLPRSITQTLRHGGIAAIDPALRATLGVDRPLPVEASLALFAEIRHAHCDALPDESIERMVDVQRARDGQMADALVRAAASGRADGAAHAVDGAVLVAGAGHVRNDRGVPWALHGREPAADVASVAFVEVRDTVLDAAAYARDAVADAVWFTPRVDDSDPCEVFRAQRRPKSR